MTHTQESKQNLQSDELWFVKTNYPANWLSKRSIDIINKIMQKNE